MSDNPDAVEIERNVEGNAGSQRGGHGGAPRGRGGATRGRGGAPPGRGGATRGGATPRGATRGGATPRGATRGGATPGPAGLPAAPIDAPTDGQREERASSHNSGGNRSRQTVERAKPKYKNYNSITFRPKNFEYELTLNLLYIGIAAVCVVLSIIVVITACIYRNAYKAGGNAQDKFTQEQGAMMRHAENAWILAAFTAVACIAWIASVFVSHRKIERGYREWIDGDEKTEDELELIKTLSERRLLSFRYIAVFAIVLAFIIGYLWLAIWTWNNGSHDLVTTWPKRKVLTYENKGTPKEKKKWKNKKIEQKDHPKCTEERLDFCSEITQLNYSLIAATTFHIILFFATFFIWMYLKVVSKRPAVKTLRRAP